MKRFIKNNIIGFILGAVIFSSITVAAYSILANDIGYTPKDSTWKKSNGEDITNVKDAIDELYSKSSSKLIKEVNINNISNELDQKIDGTVSKSYTAENDELMIITFSETGDSTYSNSVETTGTILSDTQNQNIHTYGPEIYRDWYVNIRTVVIKLEKDDTVSINSYGKVYGSGQYSITHIK